MKEKIIFDEEKKIGRFRDFLLVHGFSTLKAGNMSYNWGSKEAVNRNLRDIYHRLELEMNKEIHILPEFGPNIEIVTKENQGQTIECDGLVTTVTDLPLGLHPADCLPIVLTTRDLEFAGLIHGGRKNLIEYQIVERAIRKIGDSLDIPSKKMLVRVGPGIGRCHYDVDLYLLAIEQLRKMKIPNENIRVADVCTYCSRFEGTDGYVFFSHRRARETREKDGRFAAIVALKPA